MPRPIAATEMNSGLTKHDRPQAGTRSDKEIAA
jgi:hypothetical protein